MLISYSWKTCDGDLESRRSDTHCDSDSVICHSYRSPLSFNVEDLATCKQTEQGRFVAGVIAAAGGHGSASHAGHGFSKSNK